MVESHVYKGLWWLPGDDSHKLAGTLTVTRGEAILETIGSFGHEVISDDGKERVFSPAPAAQPRILGHSADGKAITIESCSVPQFRLSMPGIAMVEYRPSVVLVGVWFAEGEDIGFDEIAIRTSDLDQWTCVSGFSSKITGDQQEGMGYLTPAAFDVHFEPPPAIPIPLDSGEEARIEFAMQQKGPSAVTTEMSITQTASLHLRFAERHGLDETAKRVSQLRNFISLAVGRPVAVLTVTAFQEDLLRPGSTNRQPIQLLWGIPHNPEVPARARHPVEMFFALPDATPSISDVMKAWFAHQDLLKPVFNLYFGMLYHPSMYNDVHFLAYAQAIETYDFRRRDPHELSSEEHKERVRTTIEAAPEQWREWLQMRLTSSNYWTLDQRIRAVLGECPAVSAKIAGAAPDEQEAFIRTFKNSRNYYTHYTPELERKAAKGVALYLLIVQLQAVIEMSLLRELGFSCDMIDAILGRVDRYAKIDHLKSAVADDGSA